MTRRLEWLGLTLIVAVGAWLRFSHFHLLEFQGDEAYAAHLALDALKTGKLPLAGLMSSVGVTNPPLFAYLLIPMFAISANPAFVSGCIALLGLAAVVITWHVGRKYYGPVTGWVAALLFAVSPWGVIYARKIWAQDFVPFFAAASIWAVHALVFGKRPKAVFWCLLLPLCVIQIHFSGVALTAAVVVILAWMRPQVDWRWAAGGLLAAGILMAPYLYLQQQTNWADFQRATKVGGKQQWEQLGGITTDPVTGYRFPSQQNVSYALAIMNAGRIEDVLGISAGREFDRNEIWASRGRGYFEDRVRIPGAVLWLQRLAFVAALVWMAIIAGKARFKTAPAVLVVWFVVPIAVFIVGGLWTYLTYFAILFPVHFLVLGEAAQRLKPVAMVYAVIAVVAVANVWFMLSYYRFVGEHGGAQGTFGSALGYKQEAARYLAERGGAGLRAESATQLALATARTQEERTRLVQQLGQPQLIQMNHRGQAELPQLEWPLLIAQEPAGSAAAAGRVLIVDANRDAFPPQLTEQLSKMPSTNFGPIKLVFLE